MATSPRPDQPAHEDVNHPPQPCAADRDHLLAVFSQLVEPVGRALQSPSEVILHDLTSVPNTVVKVYGNVTGRRVGDPGTDLLLEQAVKGFPDQYLGYETTTNDGRTLRCSTLILRDLFGEAVAALCINTDLSLWRDVQRVSQQMVEGETPEPPRRAPVQPASPPPIENSAGIPPETHVRDLDELASLLLGRAVAEVGVPVELMKKRHKVAVVRRLQERGFFLLRDAVETAAEAIGVSRFTVYNYLNEINNVADGSDGSDAPALPPPEKGG